MIVAYNSFDQGFPIEDVDLQVRLPVPKNQHEEADKRQAAESSINETTDIDWRFTVKVGFYRYKQLAGAVERGNSFNKKEELNNERKFTAFLNKKLDDQTISKNKMFLEYLLPMITLYEDCTKDEYQKIDNFLMPIWVFNNLTAKTILSRQKTLDYVECILKPNSTTIELIESLANKYCEKNVKMDISNIQKKYQQNIAAMRRVFLMAVNGFKNDGNGMNEDKDFSCFLDGYNERIATHSASEGCNEPPLTHSAKLFLDFFKGCIKEKLNKLSKEDLLEHRTNSGGCKLMVQAVANILGLPDSDQLIDQLEFNSDGDHSKEKDEYKNNLNVLLQLQGEANVIFNDAISLYKEVEENEYSAELPYKDKNSAGNWLKEEIKEYHKKIYVFTNTITNFLMKLNINVKKDKALVNVQRYLKLISSGLSGVPLWSCFLTNRYYLTDQQQDINIETIKKVVDEYLAPNQDLQYSFFNNCSIIL
ncbi:MAG: hypothetical protein VXX85_02430 [Candidatus Margulisiibacteriota bacterium]|nr:hypothetical protein [Candidatus Margulisiibacteriota bacterium]